MDCKASRLSNTRTTMVTPEKVAAGLMISCLQVMSWCVSGHCMCNNATMCNSSNPCASESDALCCWQTAGYDEAAGSIAY